MEALEIAIGSLMWAVIWIAWAMFNRWFWAVKESPEKVDA